MKERTFPKCRWDTVAQQVPQPHLNREHTTNAGSPATTGKAWLPSSEHVYAESPKQWVEGWLNAGQNKLCTHQSSGNGGWQQSSLATAEGAPEAPRHGASSINPHGALWWSGHDITLQRENTRHREHLGSRTSDSAGWHCFKLAKHLGQRVYLPEEEEAIYRLWIIQELESNWANWASNKKWKRNTRKSPNISSWHF